MVSLNSILIFFSSQICNKKVKLHVINITFLLVAFKILKSENYGKYKKKKWVSWCVFLPHPHISYTSSMCQLKHHLQENGAGPHGLLRPLQYSALLEKSADIFLTCGYTCLCNPTEKEQDHVHLFISGD